MRYFTKEMWIGGRQPPEVGSDAHWESRLRAYRRQLARLADRLSRRSMQFFERHSLHDARVTSLTLSDASAERSLARRGSRPSELPKSVTIGVNRRDGRRYALEYRSVRRFLIDFPSDRPLFHHPPDGLGDWGYDELTSAGKAFLRHEVLFASGATLLVEFVRFSWRAERTAVAATPRRRDDSTD